MNYLLDTNIIIIYSRDSAVSTQIEDKYQLFKDGNNLAISVVTLGEIDAFIKKIKLGDKRKNKINQLLGKIAKIGIDSKELISKYGDIDAFSQGKLYNQSSTFSSRNMGKNDIWIAATASLFNLTLITTDKDFNHLHNEYLKLEYIDIELFKN